MEITISLITFTLTLIAVLLAFLTLRSNSPKSNATNTSTSSTRVNSSPRVEMVGETERPVGASIMEQLVPEIRTYVLTYLDYPSLCRLSMTNSVMRKAANDDGAWKELYRKDFTLEEDTMNPVNGWKAYYAATRPIANVNSEFFKSIRERSIQSMSRLWLNADHVKCIHASGEVFSGYDTVIQSWRIIFNWDQRVNFQVRDVCARVMTDMAWVTMKAHADSGSGAFNVTNVFEFQNGQWYLVLHHSTVMVINGIINQQT